MDRFAKYGITFSSKGSDRIVNDIWANGLDDKAMKSALRKGTYTSLNLFIQDTLTGVHGLCTFPQGSVPIKQLNLTAADTSFLTNPDYQLIDGCQIASYTMPGQFSPASVNVTVQPDIGEDATQVGHDVPFEGLTAIHEFGHWFGLLHTFQGDSCSGSGDLIADTRQQRNQTTGCPQSRVSCPALAFPQPLEDPIHNYMDYSGDLW